MTALFDARNDALERAIIDDPNDLDSYLVYADWLIEQGDPRGELVTAQIAGDRGDAAQRRAAIAVFARHRDYFLGPLADTIRADAFDWRSGFIHHARLANGYLVVSDGATAGTPLAEISAMLFRHASSRFLVKLTIGDGDLPDDPTGARRRYVYYRPEPRDVQGVLERVGTDAPLTLRELVLGHDPGEHRAISNVGRLDVAYPGLTMLTDLEVFGRFTVGTITLPNLRRATFHPHQLGSPLMKDIARATWPRLQSLTIEFGESAGGNPVSVADIDQLLRRVDLTELDHLALIGCTFTNHLFSTLASSPLLARITELDLSDGSLTDQGIRAVAREHNAFRHLELFVVTGNRITESGMNLLRRLNPNVIG